MVSEHLSFPAMQVRSVIVASISSLPIVVPCWRISDDLETNFSRNPMVCKIFPASETAANASSMLIEVTKDTGEDDIRVIKKVEPKEIY